jgi:hypothetical protein
VDLAMKKEYAPIPYEIFLSELYLNLKEYFHPEHKKSPVFRIYAENVNYIATCIEKLCNNKITIDRNPKYLENYDIYPYSAQFTLYKAIVPENLYPPYFHPNWRTFIKDGILEYLFNNESCIVEYFNKTDMKLLKDSLTALNEEPINEESSEPIDSKPSLIKKLFRKIFHKSDV